MGKGKLNQVEKDRLRELEEAFALFNETSNHLTHSFEALQNQVADLQAQLAKSDAEKRQVADRLERLLNLLPAGVIVLDSSGMISDMNPSAEEILGKNAYNQIWLQVVAQVFERSNGQELITKNKTIFYLSEVELDDPPGKILLIQDVTSTRQLQEHMNRNKRLQSMGEMAASLAHQIRTPLAAALLYVSQLSYDQMDDLKRDRFTNKALHSLKHLEGLVRDMLQYAKGGSVAESVVSVDQLLLDLQTTVEQQLISSQSSLQVVNTQPDLVIKGDKDSLLTALQNLVTNAIDVVRLRAKIELWVEIKDLQWAEFIVIDYGPGISAEMQEKIFDPFFTSRAKGTGLGLAVVRTVAEAHGGEAWVESKPVTGAQIGSKIGAKFGMRLPLITAEDLV